MKQCILLLTVVLAFGVCGVHAQTPQLIAGFEGDAKPVMPAYKAKGVIDTAGAITAETALSGGKCLKLTYSFEEKGGVYAEYVLDEHFPKGFKLTGSGASFSIAAKTTGKNIWLKFRIYDSKGETFQTSKFVMNGEWQKKTFRIDENDKGMIEGVWGGDNNKTIDYPARLGVVLVEGSGDGAVFIDDVTYIPAPAKAVKLPTGRIGKDSGTVIADFSKGPESIEPAYKQKILETKAQVSADHVLSGKKALRVDCTYDSRGFAEYRLYDYLTGFDAIVAGSALSLSVFTPDDNIWIKLRIHDAKNETFQTTSMKLKRGEWVKKDFRIDHAPNGEFDSIWGGNNDKKLDLPLQGMNVIVEGEKGGSVYIDDIRHISAGALGELDALKKIAALDIKIPDKKIYLFARGQSPEFVLSYSGLVGNDVTAALTAEVKDFFGGTVQRHQETVAVKGTEVKEIKMPLSAEKTDTGYYTVTLSAEDTYGNPIGEQKTVSFGIVDGKNTARAKPGDFIYAMCAHPGGAQLDPKSPYYGWLLYLGVDMLRWDFTWGGVEPKRGEWKWENLDKLVENHLAVGVTPAPILDYFVGWASKDGKGRISDDFTPFYNYVEKTVTRYKDRLRTWEVWNEADWGFWPDEFDRYIELYQETYKRIKAIDPTLKVMNSGWAFIDRPSRGLTDISFDRTDRFLKAIGKNIDIYAYHAHGNMNELYEQKFPKLREQMKKFDLAGIPFWDNESGYTTVGRQTESDQAEMLIKKIVSVQAEGHKSYFWYDLLCDGPDPKEGEHNFGMIRYNDRNYQEPKPAYLAYHALLRQLRGLRFASSPDVGEGLTAHLFENDAEAVCVIWCKRDVEQLTYLSVGSADAVVTDCIGRAKAALVRDGKVAVNLSKLPVYVRWKKTGAAASVSLGPKVISIADIVPVLLDTDNKVKITVINPFAKPLDASLRIVPSELFRGTVTPDNIPVSLPASGTKTLEAVMRTPSLGGASDMITVTLTGSGETIGQAKASMRYSMPLAAKGRFMPGAGMNAWKHVSVFAERKELKDVVNLFEFDPTRRNMHWRNADDHSVTAKLAYDDTSLYLLFVVKDDIHFQNETDDKLWSADSVQFAVSKDGAADSVLYDVGLSGGKVLMYKRGPGDKTLSIASDEIKASVTRDDVAKTTVYEVVLLRKYIGSDVFSFNFIVNDNDGEGRKGWLWLTQGLGNARDPKLWPSIILK
ncbi:MAG: hypothetical protein HZC28_15795 [Spirochaetes bacterium]|nr:hypothetical protein [Spirochaetota bacterium]